MIFAIVLAAGSASRFGSAKQLAEYDGTALVQRCCDLAGNCCDSRYVLVSGHEWRSVTNACAPMSGFVTINEHYEDGLSSSIATGVRSIAHAADAVIVLLADQPLITPAHLKNLVATWHESGADIVATCYAGTKGVPALFGSECFSSLSQLAGDNGARKLFADARFAVRDVEFADAAVDIDRAEDLAKLASNARN